MVKTVQRRDLAFLADPPPTPTGTEVPGATEGEACRELILGIVHEMNNALGGIAVLSEIYQGSAGSDEGVGEGLGLIHKSTGRLQTLVGHLKLLNGPLRGEPTYLNLTDTVRNHFEVFAPLLPKTLTVETAFPAEELAVHLDEILLRRVLLILALNLRNDLAGQSETVQRLHIGIVHHAGSAEVTLSTGRGNGLQAAGLLESTVARVADAQRILSETGGTVIAYTSGRYVLELPLAV